MDYNEKANFDSSEFVDYDVLYEDIFMVQSEV